MLSKAVLILALSTLTVGCWWVRPNYPTLDPNAARFALRDGTATVEGTAYLRMPDEERQLCTGEDVWLVPNTPYFLWVSNQPTDRIANAIRNSAAISYVRTETCDSEGRFTFANVPAGEYLAGTIVMLQSPFRFGILRGTITQGGEIFRPVSVEAASTQTITLAR